MELKKQQDEIAVAEERLGFECVMYATTTRGLGRKRIVIPSNLRPSPLKRPCRRGTLIATDSEKSLLESLPQDLLIKVVCGVEHKDVRQLSQVSKTIREAAMIAKQCHFDYTTPSAIPGSSIEFENGDQLEQLETPNAPLRRNLKRRISSSDS